jgi:hypothetical protein
MIDATPLLWFYARRRSARLAALGAAEAQERELRGLVRSARHTRFGLAHGFAEIGGVADFQATVPLRRYEDFWRDWWEPAFPRLVDQTWPGLVPYFAASSGTTSGNTKFIPVTRPMIRGNRRAALDLLVHHMANHPQSRILAGKSFILGGSTALVERAPGVFSGDLSGIAAKEIPFWARPRTFPSPELALIADWEEKIRQLGERSLREDIRSLSGTPSWMLLFLDGLARSHPERPRRLASFYPKLEMLAHGGIGFAPYRRQFDEWLEGSRAETREVYPASEGFVAIADRGPGEGMRLIADNGIFFEFVPVDELGQRAPTRHWAATIETGVNYAVVLSTNAGLWSYVLGDTVRFVDRDPPRLLITGRTSYALSAFGEHLIGEEIERGVEEAARSIDATVTDFAVGALYPERPGERGGHLFIVEFGAPPPREKIERFAMALDAALAHANLDYRDHRQGDFGMAPPRVLPMAAGAFAAWMKSRGKLGGQNKVPRVMTDPGLLESLRAFEAG